VAFRPSAGIEDLANRTLIRQVHLLHGVEIRGELQWAGAGRDLPRGKLIPK